MTFSLPQKITYWLAGARNGSGGITFAVGVVDDARIADTDVTFFTPEGKQKFANKAVYSRTSLPVGTYVIEGEHKGLAKLAAAQMVIKSSGNVSITDMNKMLL